MGMSNPTDDDTESLSALGERYLKATELVTTAKVARIDAFEASIRRAWARAYCKVYGAPSPVGAAAWWTIGRRLAARGIMPRA